LQEPIRKVNLFAESLQTRLQKTSLDEDSAYELSRITQSAKRMSQMIQSLLDLSRINPDKLDKAPIAFADLLSQVMQDIEHKVIESKMEVLLENDALCYVDVSSFQQVIANILSNARHYSQPDVPAQVRIDCKALDTEIKIEIKDNGIGIAMEEPNTIFEPFKRLKHNDSPGSGMGLSICRQIVRAHGGSIEMSSEGVNLGCCFTIKIPKSED
jgi:chemotaxis family two-component system sensor kinase Cph1